MGSLVYELPLVFVSGMLGSAHCIGMCGAISAMMNLGTNTVRGALSRQLMWSLGRAFTYAFLGMFAGFLGARFSQSELMSSQHGVVSAQALFAILAGLLLVVQGLISAGFFRRNVSPGKGCLTASIFGNFLRGGSAGGVFVAGIMTGFLPCGLVYSFLALAAATTSLWKAPLLMLAFGSGTVPIMLVTGAGLSMASLRLRERMMKVAAVCVVVTGLLTTGRGIAFAMSSGETPPEERCPFCEAAEATGSTETLIDANKH